MGAGLAIIAILGGVASYFIVGPSGLIGTLVTLSVGGSVTTLVAALLMPAGRRPEEMPEPTGATPRVEDCVRTPLIADAPVSDPVAAP